MAAPERTRELELRVTDTTDLSRVCGCREIIVDGTLRKYGSDTERPVSVRVHLDLDALRRIVTITNTWETQP